MNSAIANLLRQQLSSRFALKDFTIDIVDHSFYLTSIADPEALIDYRSEKRLIRNCWRK